MLALYSTAPALLLVCCWRSFGERPIQPKSVLEDEGHSAQPENHVVEMHHANMVLTISPKLFAASKSHIGSSLLQRTHKDCKDLASGDDVDARNKLAQCCGYANAKEIGIRQDVTNFTSVVNGCQGCQCPADYRRRMAAFHRRVEEDEGLTKGFDYRDWDEKRGTLSDEFDQLNAKAAEIYKGAERAPIEDLIAAAVHADTAAKVAANSTRKYASDLIGLQHGEKTLLASLDKFHRTENKQVFKSLHEGELSSLDDRYRRFIEAHGVGTANISGMRVKLKHMGYDVSVDDIVERKKYMFEELDELRKKYPSATGKGELETAIIQLESKASSDLGIQVIDPGVEAIFSTLSASWKPDHGKQKQFQDEWEECRKEYRRWLFEKERRALRRTMVKQKELWPTFEELDKQKKRKEMEALLRNGLGDQPDVFQRWDYMQSNWPTD